MEDGAFRCLSMMRKSIVRKKTMLIAAVVLAVILLFPIRLCYKDGGSVEYRAILYSVYMEHSLSAAGKGYNVGTVVTILGFEVFNNVQNDIQAE